MWKNVCAFLLVFVMVDGVPTTPFTNRFGQCNTDSDCGVGECCQMLSRDQIISRKRGFGENATCQRYQKLDEYCDPFDEYNGYCGCEPGTRCTFRLTTTPPPPTTPTTPYIYPDTFPTSTENPHQDTTTTSSEVVTPCDRKKRLLEEGGTYECQPI